MNRIKDFFSDTLGFFGLLLWFCATLFVGFFPLFLLGLPILFILFLEFVIVRVPVIGSIVLAVVWFLAFFQLSAFPTVITVLYFIGLAIYIVFSLIPDILNIISIIFDRD